MKYGWFIVCCMIYCLEAVPMDSEPVPERGFRFMDWMRPGRPLPRATSVQHPVFGAGKKSKKNPSKETAGIPQIESNKNKRPSHLNLRTKKSVHKLKVWEDHDEEHEAALNGVETRHKIAYFNYLPDHVIDDYVMPELNIKDASRFALVSKRMHSLETFPFKNIKSIKHLMEMVENNQLKPYMEARLKRHIEQVPFLKVSREASDAMMQMEAKKGWNKEFVGRVVLIMDHWKRRKDAEKRRLLSHKWLGLAAKFNNSELYDLLSSNPKVGGLNSKTLEYAIMEKDVDMFKFLLGKYPANELTNQAFIRKLFDVAVGKAGCLSITRYLQERFYVTPQRDDLNAASETGNYSLVRYLSEQFQLRPDYETLNCAAKSGNYDVFKYISDQEPPNVQADELILNEAVKRGSLQLVRYIVEDQNVDPSGATVESASENENRSILKYIKEFVEYVHSRFQSAVQQAQRRRQGRRLMDPAPSIAGNTFYMLNENE